MAKFFFSVLCLLFTPLSLAQETFSKPADNQTIYPVIVRHFDEFEDFSSYLETVPDGGLLHIKNWGNYSGRNKAGVREMVSRKVIAAFCDFRGHISVSSDHNYIMCLKALDAPRKPPERIFIKGPERFYPDANSTWAKEEVFTW